VDKTVLSMHNHNDLGMAAWPTITGNFRREHGRWKLINGIAGERAGKCFTREVAMTLKVHKDLGVYRW
jgi:isopropylmalate/homocitrate/citramalate synthase